MTKKSTYIPVIATILLIIITAAMGSFDLMVQKWVSLACLAGIVVMLFLPKAKNIFKEYTSPLLVVLIGYVVWNGISMFYADVPKAALFEFTKLIGACAVFFGVLFFTKPTKSSFLSSCTVMSIATAFFGIISIDAASNGPLAAGFKAVMGLFTDSMQYFGVFENGIRITGIFGNANSFSGFMALGVLLSLALVLNSESKKNKNISLSLLAINSLSYVLLFSLGSLFMFLVACIVMILTSHKGSKLYTLVLMVETAFITLIFTGVSLISMGTSFVLPLIAVVLNMAVLCAVDSFITNNLIAKLATKTKQSMIAGIIFVVVLLGYVVAALCITGPLTLAPSETVMRAEYLDAGDYILESSMDIAPVDNVNGSGAIPFVRITTQNQTDLKVHTSTELFNGPLTDAKFSVPEDSEIVKIYFMGALTESTISQVACLDAATNNAVSEVKLDYKLLPAIVANRIQDLAANENTVQRIVFFQDGMKLFKQSPIIGHGLSGYETGVASVQNFYYETRYVHNHYIQALCDLGIVGLALFLSILVGTILAILGIYKRSKLSNHESGSAFIVPLMVAVTIQIFGQAVTDLTWSAGPFLAIAFGIFALLIIVSSKNFELVSMIENSSAAAAAYHCSDNSNSSTGKVPNGKSTEKTVVTGAVVSRVGIILVTLTMTVLLTLNLYSHYKAASGNCTMDQMAQLTKLDKFEGDDYKTTYIVTASTYGLEENFEQANKFADELKNNPDVVLNYLLPFYFNTGQDEKLFDTAALVAKSGKAAPEIWNRLFDIFNTAIDTTRDDPMPIIMHLMGNKEYYIDGLLDYYRQLQDRNNVYLDDAMLDISNVTFLSKILGLEHKTNADIIAILDLFVKTIYTSEYSIDVNTDGIPDNFTILNGEAVWTPAPSTDDVGGGFTGAVIATPGTSLELQTYCGRGGNYTLRFADLAGLDGNPAPRDITVTVDGTPLEVQYDSNGAYVTVKLHGPTEADEANKVKATPASAEKITISLPSGMSVSKLSLMM